MGLDDNTEVHKETKWGAFSSVLVGLSFGKVCGPYVVPCLT